MNQPGLGNLKRGIFYNSKKSLCSIWESGKMCYDVLSESKHYTLNYSEETILDYSYDFAIFNHHFTVNNWINKSNIEAFNKPTFCIVTEVSFSKNYIEFSPDYFSHYIVLDPTITETKNIHAFGRPLENYMLTPINLDSVPNIFSFGFATYGKEWHKIVDVVQSEYDNANIRFNIPKGTHVPKNIHDDLICEIKHKCNIIKPGIKLIITHDELSKEEIISICSKQTINCFFYNRQHLFKAGLSAVTDQAISSGRPLLITDDCTFRHIHKYIKSYPTISLKEAIETTQQGVLQMKKDWSRENFIFKFENILNNIYIEL